MRILIARRGCLLTSKLLPCALFACLLINPTANAQQTAPQLLSYDELVQLYEQESPPVAFVGKFKLDWIFVRPPAITEPYEKGAPHRFSPHFGRTLKSLNNAVQDGISDHSPIMLDLPLNEPTLAKSKRRRNRN